MKNIKDFILVLVLLAIVGVYSQVNMVSAAESEITMTALYESGDYDTARKNASDLGQIVTVSSLDEVQLFRKACLEDKYHLRDLSFVQTKNIIASDITTSFDEESDRILIMQEGQVTASIAQQIYSAPHLYQGMTSVETTWEQLGLEQALMKEYDDESFVYFDGTYDGSGYCLQGFLGTDDDMIQNMMNSFFYLIGTTGCVKNVEIKDCLMMQDGALAYGILYGGIVQNCKLNQVCIYGTSIGGIVEGTSIGASIVDCTVVNSDLVLERKYNGNQQSTSGNVGGIVGKMQGGLVEGCQVTDTRLYGTNNLYTYVGGIAGRTYPNGEYRELSTIKNCVSDVTISQSYCAGGILGKQWTSVEINRCLSISQMQLFQKNSKAGGIVGAIEDGDRFVLENSCSIGRGAAYFSGGLIGTIANVPDDFKICNCLMLEQAKGTMSASLMIDVPEGHIGDISYCYVPKGAGSYFADKSQETTNCAMVTASQLAGTEKTKPILQSKTYGNYYSMVELLNACATNYGYDSWVLSDKRYPVPVDYHNLPEINLPEEAIKDPSDTPIPTVTPILQPSSTPTPRKTPVPTKSQNMDSDIIARLQLQEIKIALQPTNKITLRWKKNTAADGILIYRRIGKGKFCKIGQCNGDRAKFVWKHAKPGKKYTFRIQAYVKQQGKTVYGKVVSRKVQMPYLKTPSYRLSVGVNALHQKYMQIALKKYQGNYIEIYLKKERGQFAKAAMRTNKIAPYKGKIRFTYQKGGTTYYCKLRTYRMKNGKKQYSGYSRVMKIRT